MDSRKEHVTKKLLSIYILLIFPMRSHTHSLIISILVIFLTAGNVTAQQIPTDNQVKTISSSEKWLKLIHFNKVKKNSDIKDKNFFLATSTTEEINPLKELKATIEALRAPVKIPDEHAQCKFPARYLFIKEQLPLMLHNSPKVTCKKFNSWFKNSDVSSLSLIFATGYLDNPASYYGHLLLKFNNESSAKELNLLDQSLNFGANVPENENPIRYIMYGLTGGYEAVFSDEHFYRHNHSYGEVDLRDMWEYELSLDKKDVDLVIAHSWELIQTQFTYYFLKENCAYRLAELLELVLEEPLFSKSKSLIFPYTIINSLSNHSYKKKPIVNSIRRIPSRHSKFVEKFSALKEELQQAVYKVVTGNYTFNNDRYRSLSNTEKSKVLEVLIDYTEFQSATDKPNTIHKNNKTKILIERISLPPSKSNITYDISSPPHLGQKPSMVRLGLSNNSSNTIISYRPAYYDLLTINHGRINNSKLINLQVDLSVDENRVQLKEARLLDIFTLNLSKTGLPSDGGFGWRVFLGYKSLSNSCSNCKVTLIETGLGKGVQFTPKITGYLFGNLIAVSNNHFTERTTINASLGLLVDISESIKSHINYKKFNSDFSPNIKDESFSLETRFGSSKSWDIRVKATKQDSWQNSISYGYYF